MRLINADAVIEILKGNKQFFIDAWGGSFHAMSEKAKARYDEIDNCIATILNAPTIKLNDDTISRRAAILAITGEPPEAHYPSWYAERIKALPSAQDSRQRGEWIFEPKDAIELMFTLPKCSECGFESSDGGNFCSNCGARMKGGAE